LCGGCVDVCPENCLELVSLDRIQFDEATIGQLAEDRELLGVELDDIQADELGIITGSVMLKMNRAAFAAACARHVARRAPSPWNPTTLFPPNRPD